MARCPGEGSLPPPWQPRPSGPCSRPASDSYVTVHAVTWLSMAIVSRLPREITTPLHGTTVGWPLVMPSEPPTAFKNCADQSEVTLKSLCTAESIRTGGKKELEKPRPMAPHGSMEKEVTSAGPEEKQSKYEFVIFLYIFLVVVNECFLQCRDYTSCRYNMYLYDKN